MSAIAFAMLLSRSWLVCCHRSAAAAAGCRVSAPAHRLGARISCGRQRQREMFEDHEGGLRVRNTPRVTARRSFGGIASVRAATSATNGFRSSGDLSDLGCYLYVNLSLEVIADFPLVS